MAPVKFGLLESGVAAVRPTRYFLIRHAPPKVRAEAMEPQDSRESWGFFAFKEGKS
jgi:hypothetical protein